MATSRKKRINNKQNGNHSNNGKAQELIKTPVKIPNISAKTPGQIEYIRTIDKNIITIAIGPSGTGKTAIAIAKGVQALRSGQVGKMIITRPALESGESLGYLPGNSSEKFHEYISHTLDEIKKWTTEHERNVWSNERIIDYKPIAFMRGANYHNSFIVVDEAQNCLKHQLKLLLTRIGVGSKMILVGDIKQTDLNSHQEGGLKFICENLYDIKGIGVAKLMNEDIIRNSIIGEILERFEK